MNKMMLKKQYMMYSPKKKGRLPSAYQEVEYIESTGTQYIDSGLSINNPLSFKAEFKWRKTSTSTADQCLAGARYVTNYSIGYKGANCYNHGLELAPEFSLNVSFNDNTDYDSVFEGGNSVAKYTQNGTTYTSSNPYNQFNTYGYNITLFAMNQGGSIQWFFIGRLYHYRFTINGTKVRDFIPCYRKSDNEIGLYDIVNNQFYTNQGTGTFLCGRPLVYDTISGYQQIDYIETTGTQYIDTGLNWDNGYKMKGSVLCSESSSSTDMSLCGCRLSNNWLSTSIVTSAYNWKAEYFANSASKFQIAYNTSWLLSSDTITANVFYDFESYLGVGEQYLKVNGETKISNTIASQGYAEYLRTTKLLIFGRSGEYSDKNLPSQLFKGKLKFFKIFLNDVLVREFIPMRRKLDNELGLYDLVNKVFYTNQGSGSFIAGEVLKS